MRIDEIRIQNFKHFKDQSFRFHPNFNLVIGVNGSGKTALLNALSVAMGAFVYGVFDDPERRRMIDENEVRVVANKTGNMWRFDQILPCVIEAQGEVFGRPGTWNRPYSQAYTTVHSSQFNFKQELISAINAVEQGIWATLPVLAFYGCDRLWRQSEALIPDIQAATLQISRLDAFQDCFHTGANDQVFSDWIVSKTIERLASNHQSNGTTTNQPDELAIVNKAISDCLENAKEVRYDPAQKMVVVEFEERDPVPFRNLSDGQRVLLAMVGDIARRATILNPHLGKKVLLETPGVVLVDELDLHLHPKWQRRVIEDLRRTFPKIQFICTTHSPFLIQSLRSEEELIQLDGENSIDPFNKGIEAITAGIMGVSNPEVSPRYFEMLEAAKAYLAELDEAANSPKERLEAYKEQLASRIAPFADNPAFQAVLEMERLAKLGE